MGVTDWIFTCFILFMILLMIAISKEGFTESKKSLKTRLTEATEENEKLHRKLYEDGREVVVQFRTGTCVTYGGVHYSYKDSDYIVLRDYDDKTIATISRKELSHVSSLTAIKEERS